MHARTLMAVLAMAATCSPVAAREFTIVSRSGAWDQAQHQVYFAPFTFATGIAIDPQTWPGAAAPGGPSGIDSLREQVKSGSPAWDLVQMENEALQPACDEGLLEKLDWSAIGGREHYLPQGVSDCGVGAVIYTYVLAWDRDKLQGAPTWADFWDVTKYPGKRGLRRGARTNLEFALLADGVAPGDVYKVLRTSDGVDRAFHKLDQLRPYILWWQTPDESARILTSSEVLMTSAPNGRITLASRSDNRNFGMQWAGSLYAIDSWAIPKGSANRKQSYQFLYMAGTAAIQARMIPVAPYPGLAKGVNDFTPPELQPISPVAPANMGAGIPIDEQFWRENQDKLNQRFESWLSRG
ncbi:MAG: extracellular solute-binding protein [Acetobacteraceae bacterium]|nr:extracellular solute-binding protein [Acetobacteraceae bacterium]MBV8590023.1 extracellular solute-binding protein [Acetobacteraceae bacterium]